MAMTGFICHDDYYDRIKRLTNEEVGNLFRQLMLYHAGRYDEMEDFVDSEGIAFDFIRSDIDRMEEKFNSACETNRINGSKGGRPRKRKEPTETEQNPEEPKETEQNRTKPTETEQNPEKPCKDKEKDKDKDKKEKEIQKENRFARFWEAYPRKEGKPAAHRSFMSINPDESLLQKMLDAIAKWKPTEQWSNPQYIPHPTTWLNQRRWEDEPPKPGKGKTVYAQQYEQREYQQSGNMDDVLDMLRARA